MKIIFMGTPDFAAESLKAIYEAGHEILSVVTNPDRPKGRGMKLIATPVKQYAQEKEIKILYLYPDMLELYGDYGNIQVLKYRMEKRNIKCKIDRYSIGDAKPNFCEYDIVFAGGGADNEQSILAEDLVKYSEEIKLAVQKGVFFLLICGAYQLFGKYYKGVEGNIIPGLDVFPYYTEAVEDRKKRCIGNIILEVELIKGNKGFLAQFFVFS